MNVISWNPVLTDHQSYTLEALQQAAKCTLTVYVSKSEHPSRQVQGWVNLHATSLCPKLIPENSWFQYIVKQLRDQGDAVHLFASPFESPRLIVTLMLAIGMGLKVFLISEPYSPISAGYQTDKHKLINSAKALLRPYLYHFYGALLRRRIAGVFAISTLAASQYQSIGISKNKIFPFGYFVPRSEDLGEEVPVTNSKKSALKVIFIGTLIIRKGLDVLIKAIKNLNRDQVVVTLDIYGHGDASQFDLDQSSIRYCGSIPFGRAQAVITGYDLLVVPSRYDGWGVVVNEALLAGVPVICSNRVGAGSIVEKWQCGSIFTSENVSDLESKLNDIIVAPESLANMRLAARKMSAILEPEFAGRFMNEVLSQSSTNPSCSWYEGLN